MECQSQLCRRPSPARGAQSSAETPLPARSREVPRPCSFGLEGPLEPWRACTDSPVLSESRARTGGPQHFLGQGRAVCHHDSGERCRCVTLLRPLWRPRAHPRCTANKAVSAHQPPAAVSLFPPLPVQVPVWFRVRLLAEHLPLESWRQAGSAGGCRWLQCQSPGDSLCTPQAHSTEHNQTS